MLTNAILNPTAFDALGRYKRLKVPPSIAQFTNTLDKSTAAELFRVMDKYRPEDKKTKVQRLKDTAAAKVDGKDDKKAGPRPLVVKYGINHITALIEKKKAQLVVIAHDVDPIEVYWSGPSSSPDSMDSTRPQFDIITFSSGA